MHRILLVAHDEALRASRAAVLRKAGYAIDSVITVEEALSRLGMNEFSLVIVGRNSSTSLRGAAQRLREDFPSLPILKIDMSETEAVYASRVVDPFPEHLLAAIREMLSAYNASDRIMRRERR